MKTPAIYPPECTRAAAHLRRLKCQDAASKQHIEEAENALSRAALELHFLETLMRTAQQTLADLLADDKANRQARAEAEAANVEFAAANADLQKQLDDLKANPPAVDPNTTIPADDPTFLEANALLDGKSE